MDLLPGRERIVRHDGVKFARALRGDEPMLDDFMATEVIDDAEPGFAACLVDPYLPAVGGFPDLAPLERWCCFRFGEFRRFLLGSSASHRYFEMALLGVNAERRRFGRGPHHRPIAGGDRQPEAMILGYMRGGVVELDSDAVAFSGLERRRLLMAVAMAEVQDAIADPRGCAVGPQAVESYRDQCDGLVYAESENEKRRADEIDPFRQGFAVEGQRAGIVLALIARKLGPKPDDAELPAVEPRRLWRADGLSLRRPSRAVETASAEVKPV